MCVLPNEAKSFLYWKCKGLKGRVKDWILLLKIIYSRLKDEKSIMSDISHVSDKQYKKIQEETDALAQLGRIIV